ncbi:TPM domain-containing protein [Scytonema sp. NUACC26]|uniref:TPM domain-containing protein n=1 Tax=Scytonema sp. NUACC26 TaxID=3140176 RepID=UPI0034DC1857
MLVKLFKQILWLGTLCLFLILYTPFSYALQIQDIPNPRQQYGGWVTDMANILSPETEAQLNKMIANLEAKNGTEIAVVTVLETQPAISPKAFATELFNTWGIGKKSKNNGVLFLVSTGDRRVEIERGSGLRTSLSDRKIRQIIDSDIIPRFRQGYLEAGILKGTENAIAILESPTTLSDSHQNNITDFPGYIWIIGNLSWLGFIGFSARLLLFYCKPQILGVKQPDARERFSALELELSQPPSKLSKEQSFYQRLVAISFIGLIFTLFYGLGWEIVKEHQAEKLNSPILIGEVIWLLMLYFLPYITARITSLIIATVTAIVLFPFPSTCVAIALSSILSAICLNIPNGKKERMSESLGFILGMTVLGSAIFVFVGTIYTSREKTLTVLTVTSLLFALQNAPAAWEIIPILQKLCKKFSSRPTYQCSHCHQIMQSIPQNNLSAYLSPAEQMATKLGSVSFEGWLCAKCQQDLSPPGIYLRSYLQDLYSSVAFRNSFSNCPTCQELTVVRGSSKVLQEPTWKQAGIRGVRQECHCCGYTNDIQETIPSLELPKNALLILPQGRSHGVAEEKHYPVHCANCRNPMTAIRGEKLRPFLILNDLVRSRSGGKAASQDKIERIGWYCATCYPELNEKTIHIRTYTSRVVSKRRSSHSKVEPDNSTTYSETSWSAESSSSWSSDSGGNYGSESSSSWSSDSGGSYSSGSDFGGGMSDGGGAGGSW